VVWFCGGSRLLRAFKQCIGIFKACIWKAVISNLVLSSGGELLWWCWDSFVVCESVCEHLYVGLSCASVQNCEPEMDRLKLYNT